MKGALWSVVSAFAVVLQVAADIPIQADLDITKLQGKWHAIALVLDQGEVTSTLGRKTRMVPKKNGDVVITKLIPENNTCRKEKLRLLHTDVPGKFTTKAQSTVRVVETDYDNYCMNHVETSGGNVNALHLYTRKAEPSDEVKEKFKAVAKSLGFQEDKIIYLTKPDPCRVSRNA